MIFRRKIAGASAAALARFLARARRAAGLRGQVNVLVTGNAELRGLNRRFRGLDKPTDVLSFPSPLDMAGKFGGDIAISADMARENARRMEHDVSAELKVLMLHGVLHLAGYDHETDKGRMRLKEEKLRQELGLPSSLTERASKAGRRRR